MTQKYTTNTRIRFRNAEGRRQTIEGGMIIPFDEGDKCDIDMLLLNGAIEKYTEPEDIPEPPVVIKKSPKSKGVNNG